MAGRLRPYLVITTVIATLLALAFLVKDSKAGFQFQTVPTVAPTQADATATTTATADPAFTALPTSAAATSAATLTEPQLTQPAGQATPAAPTAGLPTSISTSPTPSASQTTVMKGPIQETAPSPTEPGTISASESWIKSIYVLICGLGLVAAFVIIGILLIRKAIQGPKPPIQGQPG
jgi:hypothetical protein